MNHYYFYLRQFQPYRTAMMGLLASLLPALSLAQPTITAVQPAVAPVGASVTLTGTGFGTTAAQNAVYFGAVPTLVLTASATALTVAVPAGATSGAPVTVTNLATQRTASSLASATPAFRVTFAGGALATGAYRRTDVLAGFAVERLAVGDFNRDGQADVVATARSVGSASGLAVLLNQGNRAFAAPFPVDANILPVGVAVGDLNGDGNLDIVAANQVSQDVSVVLGNGQGGFATPDNYGLSSNGTGQVLVADVNGDGRPDVLTLELGQVVVLYNTGAGRLSFAAPLSTASGTVSSFGAGDFNGDGRLDVVHPDQQGTQVGFTAVLSTSTSAYTRQFVAAAGPLENLMATDFNNDGRADVLATGSTGTQVWLRTAAGTGFGAPTATSVFPVFRTDLAVSDLDGNGLLDVLATANGQPALLLPGTGTGGFVAPAVGVANPNGARTLAVGDLDGDGRGDFVTGNEFNNSFSLFTYVGAGSTANTPTLDVIPDQTVSRVPITLTVPLTGIGGGGGAGQFITVTASSSAPAAVSTPVVSYTSPAATGSLTFTVNGPAAVTVTVSNGQATNGTVSRTFQVRLALATRGPAAQALLLYPNPSASGRFWLANPEQFGRGLLTVTDAAGRRVHAQALPGGPTPAEVQLPAPVAAGVYFVQVGTGSRAWRGKLLVQP
ncbi:MAG TPA: T9SS type A sorting domain-containing protein [Hymenobacter sp.]|jgi:hypothetical protein|uniref:T9SS type A sorting domain-containing protein n=1 Tax=Hymenobacter sp. TaxID=1898978 RepID=UPI002EDBB827